VLILALVACETAGPAVDWALTPAELGDPVVDREGFDPTDGAGLGAAFPQVLPGYAEATVPAADVPLAIWEIALHELVAEAGVCPYTTLDGAVTQYQTNCRSKHGYDWEGSVRVEPWEDGDTEGVRYDFDIEVVGDVDTPRFDSLRLDGVVVRVERDGVEHVDVNLMAELLGYFQARQQPDDPRIASWADWRATGSVELDGEDLRVDLGADVGGSGGFGLVGEGLAVGAGCPSEPTGEAWMADEVGVVFEGAAACDACATVTAGEASTAACAP